LAWREIIGRTWATSEILGFIVVWARRSNAVKKERQIVARSAKVRWQDSEVAAS
jgi:hypothetical protein